MYRQLSSSIESMCLVALAIMSLVLVAAIADAGCDMDCAAATAGVCTGPSTGSCPACPLPGPPLFGLCSNSSGITSFTGAMTRGSTTGGEDIAFNQVPCKINRACFSGTPMVGSCVTMFIFVTACNPDVPGGCTPCQLAAPMVSANAQYCYVQTPSKCTPLGF